MNTRTKALLMAGALIAAASTLDANASPAVVYGHTASQPEDQVITDAVVKKISGDSSLSGQIGVDTADGVVTLTGVVDLPGQQASAESDALSVDGVMYVENEVSAKADQDF